MLQAMMRRLPHEVQCRHSVLPVNHPVDLAWSSLACKVVSLQEYQFSACMSDQ